MDIKYINDVQGWGISKDELHSQSSNGVYKLLTLDIDFGTKCSLHCPHCFKKEFNKDTTIGRPLAFNEIKNIIQQAKDLGLKSIKILGAGEPFENEELLNLLHFNTSLDIHTCIFTKGHVLGSDEFTKQYYHKHGINDAKSLVEELFSLRTSILLGFNSFDEKKQLSFCGLTQSSNFDYVKYRNNALKMLIEAGFNKFDERNPEATRMALICAPYKLSNIEEAFEIYKWGRKRNIYVVICPSTDSGRGHIEQEQIKRNQDKFYSKSIKLYTSIYKWAIQNRYILKDDFIKDGVSLYPGAHVCNQIAAGLYITGDGKVMRCPGRDGGDYIVTDDVRKKTLKEIWQHSENYKCAEMKGKFNFYCTAREKNLFTEENFYHIVFEQVLKAV